jgi:hypothetical protein
VKTEKIRKNFNEVIDLIQKDNQLASVALHQSEKDAVPEIIELAKKDVVRRCNDELQSKFLKRIDGYSLGLSSAAHHFDRYSQMAKIKFPSLLQFVRNASWSDALKIFREVDDLYSTAEAMINSCYTQFKMILDINNEFYEENQDRASSIVRSAALNMDEEQCQETRPILLIAAITFLVIPIIPLILEYIQRGGR